MPITVAPASASARANCRWLDGKNGSTNTTFMSGMVTGGYVSPMVTAGFVAPYLLDTTTRFVEAAARLPDVRLALITCEPADRLPPQLRQHLAGHWRIDDPLDPGQIAAAVQGLSRQLGPVERLLAVLEQLQVPLAQVREHLGIAGMDPVTANNFRDKAQMKTVLRAAGVPCARHKLAVSPADALEFAERVGLPARRQAACRGRGEEHLPARRRRATCAPGSIRCRPRRTGPRRSRSSSPATRAPTTA